MTRSRHARRHNHAADDPQKPAADTQSRAAASACMHTSAAPCHTAVQVLRARPEVFYRSSIYATGELLLFLRADLALPQEQLPGCITWAADLPPTSSRAAMAAVVACLRDRVLPPGVDGEALLQLLASFPAVLGWPVDEQLLPRLSFLEGLGSQGQQLMRGTMYEQETGWFQVGAGAATAAAQHA